MIDNKVLMVEDIILYFLGKLFINKEISSSGYFRVIKDASVILNHDTSKYLLDRMINTIEKREMANPIFLQISNDTPKRLKRILENVFNINSDNIFSDATILDYNRFMSHKLLSDKYSYKPFEPCVYEVAEERYSIFSCIKEKHDLLQISLQNNLNFFMLCNLFYQNGMHTCPVCSPDICKYLVAYK